jgi:hypothetical protein
MIKHRTFHAMGTSMELTEADARGIPAVLVTTGGRAQLAGGLA